MNHTDGHGDMSGMYFEDSSQVVILFKQWETTNYGEYIPSIIAIFLFAVLHEYITTFRLDFTAKKSDMKHGSTLASLLYFLSVAFSYLIMLMVMTFNVGVFFAVLFGLGTGFFFFGQSRTTTSSDVCCS